MASAPALADSNVSAGQASATSVQVEINPAALSGVANTLSGVNALQLELDHAQSQAGIGTTTKDQSSVTHATGSLCSHAQVDAGMNHIKSCLAQDSVQSTLSQLGFDAGSATSTPFDISVAALQNATAAGLVQSAQQQVDGAIAALPANNFKATLQSAVDQAGNDLNAAFSNGELSRSIAQQYPARKGTQTGQVYDIAGAPGCLSEYKFAPFTATTTDKASSASNTTESLTIGGALDTVSAPGSCSAQSNLQAKLATLKSAQTTLAKALAATSAAPAVASATSAVTPLLAGTPAAGLDAQQAANLDQALSRFDQLAAAAAAGLDLTAVLANDISSATTVTPQVSSSSGTSAATATSKVSDIKLINITPGLQAMVPGLSSLNTGPLVEVIGATSTAQALADGTAKNTTATATSGLGQVIVNGATVIDMSSAADSAVGALGTVGNQVNGTPAGGTVNSTCQQGMSAGTTCVVNAGPLQLVLTRGFPVIQTDTINYRSASASIQALEIDINYNSGSAPRNASTSGGVKGATSGGPVRIASISLGQASASSSPNNPGSVGNLSCVGPLYHGKCQTGDSGPLGLLAGLLTLMVGIGFGFGPKALALVRVR